MASQADVAKIADVSPMTVSRVVNDDPRVKGETRKRVQYAIEKLNYYPNAAARMLNSQRAMTIALIFPSYNALTEPYFSQLIFNIEKNLRDYNYDLLITSFEHKDREDLSTLYKQKKADALIIVSSLMNDLRLNTISKRRIPTVLIHSRSTLPYLNYVDVDNYSILEQFVDYLYSLGHRRIGFITGDLNSLNAFHRLEGYKKSLSRHALQFHKELIFQGNWSCQSGYKAFSYFQELSQLPTAIIVSNDHMAIGFLKAADENDINIPRELSLVGIDDIEMSSFTTPALTTIRQPIEAIAREAVKTIINSINNKNSEESHIILEAEMVVRQSCSYPPKFKK